MATSRESSLTLDRRLTLLHAVAAGELEAPTVSDLAAAIGVSRAAVYRLLQEGWETSSGELEEGAYGVAAPVPGVPGLRASVGVVTLQPIESDRVGPQVQAAAGTLAQLLTA